MQLNMHRNNDIAHRRLGMMAAWAATLALMMMVSPTAAALGVAADQQAKLLAGDPGIADQFGNASALSAATLLVGAPGNDDAGGDSGAAYVFLRTGSVWTQQAKLVATDASAQADFGFAVDIDGDIAVVGAPALTPFTGNGAVYVFVRSGSVWTQQAKLLASDVFDLSFFGGAVSIDGDTVAVGAINAPGPGIARGAAYVFVRSGASWSLQSTLTADDPALGAMLGSSVVVRDDTLIAGAPGDDDAGTSSGSAYVFVRTGTSWDFATKLLADAGLPGDDLGFSVDLDGNTVGLGGPAFVGAGEPGTGAAWVFTLSPTPWTDLGAGLAGTAGVPLLSVAGSLVGGDVVTLSLSSAAPLASATLVAGLGTLNAPFKGGTLVPSPDVLVSFSTDGLGDITFGALWPVGVPAQANVVLQYWVADALAAAGFSASNGVLGVTP